MESNLRKTPIYDWHIANHGRMVDFAGWSMPVQYSSIIDEHRATRQNVTLFDVSHMARLEFTGSGAAAFLDRLTTRKVVSTPLGKIRYSLVCNETGGILDDVLVYRFDQSIDSPGAGRSVYLIVVNASNYHKIVQWVTGHLHAGEQVEFRDLTLETAMIAVQGPRAIGLLSRFLNADPEALTYYSGHVVDDCGTRMIVSRTGYTGEDGCELIVPVTAADRIWRELIELGRQDSICAAGLGARDTLRLEAGMPLYGHELSEEVNPVQAGLGFAINLKGRDFIGKEAIERAQADEALHVRIGLKMDGRRAAREHSEIYAEGVRVGVVTSGTFSPTLNYPIAMGYVEPAYASVGQELEIDIRGKRHPAVVAELPFYLRST